MLSPRWRELGIGVVEAEDGRGIYAGYDVAVGAAEFGIRR